MMSDTDTANFAEFAGPPEPDWFECGCCGKMILTLWAPNHSGMLRANDHCLVGDEVWHLICVDKFFGECQYDY